MWRAYVKGERRFCGIDLPDGLKKDSKLDKLLITPSTKGVLEVVLSHEAMTFPVDLHHRVTHTFAGHPRCP